MFQLTILAIVALLVGIDQLTKWLAVIYLKGEETVTVISKVLGLSYVENKGAAFGMMEGGRWFFILLTSIVMLAMLALVLTGRFRRCWMFNISATLVIAGGIGNFIDRLIQGYVVDFIEVLFISFPVFNIADCCVVIGAALLLIFFCFIYDEKQPSAALPGDAHESQQDDFS